jgi:DNA-binding XRE family transcriptional regulator
MAARVGVATGTINAIERGSYKPSLALAYAISEELGENVLALFPMTAFRKLTPLAVQRSGETNANRGQELNGRPLPLQDGRSAGHQDQTQGEAG